MTQESQTSELIIYTTEDGLSQVDVRFDGDTVWLSLDEMSQLFERDKSTISRHIKNIFQEKELDERLVVAKFATTTKHGAITDKTQTHEVCFYNLDMIISVGYRVNSLNATAFRRWATHVLREYLLKGYSINRQLIALQTTAQTQYGRIIDLQPTRQRVQMPKSVILAQVQ